MKKVIIGFLLFIVISFPLFRLGKILLIGNTHNIFFPMKKTESSVFFPKSYSWAYLGMSFNELSNNIPNAKFSPYSGIIDSTFSDSRYYCTFIFNNDYFLDDGDSGPNSFDRLTKVKIIGKDIDLNFSQFFPNEFSFFKITGSEYSYMDSVYNIKEYGFATFHNPNVDILLRPSTNKNTRFLEIIIHYPIDNLDLKTYSYFKYRKANLDERNTIINEIESNLK